MRIDKIEIIDLTGGRFANRKNHLINKLAPFSSIKATITLTNKNGRLHASLSSISDEKETLRMLIKSVVRDI